MLNWKRKKVVVRIVGGDTEEIVGRSVGNFCIHKTVEDAPKIGEEWTVTHIPSGRKFITRSTQKGCVDLVEELSSNIFGFIYMPLNKLKQAAPKIMGIVGKE